MTERAQCLCFEILLQVSLTYRTKSEFVPSNTVATVHVWLLNA